MAARDTVNSITYGLPAVKRVRIDSLLSARGIFSSRSRAAASVMAGDVLLGPGRRRARKPGELVPEDVELEVVPAPRYVSRGAIKLANALDELTLDVRARRALDVGASTGGFTDCLLQRGAAHVVAPDVAYGELDWKLRSDPRVTVVERGNARGVRPDQLPEETGPALAVLLALAREAGAVLRLDEEESRKHNLEPAPGIELCAPIARDVDICFAIGGDGTILSGLRAYAGTSVPVFAVNFGEIGFLATVDREQTESGLRRAFARDFEVLALPGIE